MEYGIFNLSQSDFKRRHTVLYEAVQCYDNNFSSSLPFYVVFYFKPHKAAVLSAYRSSFVQDVFSSYGNLDRRSFLSILDSLHCLLGYILTSSSDF